MPPPALFSWPTQIGVGHKTPPTVKPDKARDGVSTEKGFLQRRTRQLMLKRLQLPGGFQVFLKQGEEESHRV